MVLLPSDYRYVSRAHCSVCFSGGKYIVTDSSSNGTYFMDKRRLPKGKAVAVEPGTSLMLAGADCSIQLG